MPTPLSIVIPAHNQARELRCHLPRILEQDFDDFEVIVVDVASTDETKDVLELLELSHPRLRHTHTPASARDISLERLALSLGFRTARHEWVVLTRADCEPASPHWLERISEVASSDKSIILGAAKYDEQHHTWFDTKVSYFRIHNTIANLRHIQDGYPAVRSDECNMAIRRSLFLETDGFGRHINLLTGAAELLVNSLSTSTNTAVVTSPEAIVVQDRMPAKRLWLKHRTFYMETRRYQRNAFYYRLKQNLKMALPWLMFLCIVGFWPVITILEVPQTTPLWILTGLLALLWLIVAIYSIVSFNRTASELGYQRKFYLSLPILSLSLPIWNTLSWFRHRIKPKNEFRKKFV